MKNFIIYISIALLLVAPIVAYGQTSPNCSEVPSNTLCNPIRFSGDDVTVFAFEAVGIASTFFIFFALIFVVFSGFRMAISQGDEEKLTVAKNALTWSIYGLVLSMFAFVIVNATGTYLGAKDINPDSYAGNVPVRNPLMDETFYALLQRMLKGFLQVSGLIVILMIIFGGFRYITSGGNEEQAEKGKKTLQWSILGLITILLAYVLVRATLTFFGN